MPGQLPYEERSGLSAGDLGEVGPNAHPREGDDEENVDDGRG
jgi:hypothetical protein